MRLTGRIWLPQILLCTLLLWALIPTNPYGFYILLRWVCCAGFAFLASEAIRRRERGWAWALSTTAALYNPFMPLHMTRALWSFVNVATIVLTLTSLLVFRTGAAVTRDDGL